MKINTYTAKGCRKENQDFLAYRTIGESDGIFVVADGMGGYDKGAEAAKVCVEEVVAYVAGHWEDGGSDAQLLQQAFGYANESLFFKRLALGVKAMGCCIVAALVHDLTVSFLWLGDSRGYLFRNGEELFRTADHSIVSELSKIKSLRAADIEKYSNVVTRSMMGDDKLGPLAVETMHCMPGDILFLCSDGLHKEVEPERIVGPDNQAKAELETAAPRFDDNLSYLEILI